MESTNVTGNMSAGFEGIAQMLLEQKKLMDALEAENRNLRRQLADLRRGVGVSVVIEGKTISLVQGEGREQAEVSDEQVSVEGRGGEQRDTSHTTRSPLTDSYVL